MKITLLILSFILIISLIEFGRAQTPEFDVFLGVEHDSVLKDDIKTQLETANLKVSVYEPDASIGIETSIPSFKNRTIIINKSKILLYILDPNSRNAIIMNEIAFLIARKCSSLVIVLTNYGRKIKTENIDIIETKDLNRGVRILDYLAHRHNVKIYETKDEAIEYIKNTIHPIESLYDDDDIDDTLNDECRANLESELEDFRLGEEFTTTTAHTTTLKIDTTTEAEETTTNMEDDSEFPTEDPNTRRKRSNDDPTTMKPDEVDNEDDDGEFIDDQCEIEEDYDLYEPILPQYNGNINHDIYDFDAMYDEAFEEEAVNSDNDKLPSKIAWEILTEKKNICPKFLSTTQSFLKDHNVLLIDKPAFKIIGQDCLDFERGLNTKCESWTKPDQKIAHLYIGVFNISNSQKIAECNSGKSGNLTCYYPNKKYYDISEIGIEITNIMNSHVKLIIIPRDQGYNIGLSIMASYLIGIKTQNIFIDLHTISQQNHYNFPVQARTDYNYARTYLKNLANRDSQFVFTSHKNNEAKEKALSTAQNYKKN